MRISKVKYAIKAFVIKFAESAKRREPEKLLYIVFYAVNVTLIALQCLVLRNFGGERQIPILITSILVSAQFYVPFLLASTIPPYHIVVACNIIGVGLLLRLVDDFPVYYYAVAFSLPLSAFKLDLDIFSLSPLIIKTSVKITRALKKARLPSSTEELKVDFKLASVYILGVTISVLVYILTSQVIALGVAVYNAMVALSILLHVAAIPFRAETEKYSLAVLFVMRYPSLYRLVNHMKLKLHPLVERSGRLIYEFKFLSKFVVTLVTYAMFVPTILITLFILVPPPWIYVIILVLVLIGVLIYQLPFLIVKSYIGARKRRVEREYPFFVAYATAMVSSGLNLYQAMVQLASAKGRELLRAFSEEAKILRSLVERRGMPELKALEYYASLHPSDELRNFVFGYIHQAQMGGNVVLYLEHKLNEALEITKRKLDVALKNMLTLTEISILILVMPSLPMILGFILAPDLIQSFVIMYMLAIVPSSSAMFLNIASSVQPPYKNIYVFRYVYSTVFAVAGLVVSTVVLNLQPTVALAVVIASAALGHYIEFAKQQKEFSDIEKAIPDFFRDLAELRNLMSVPEALRRMTTMNYPKGMREVIVSWVRLRDLGVKLSDQPWHTRSWFMRFAHFIVGKIEDFGGGTPQLFRILMSFFTEYKNIMIALRSNLRMYEVVVWIVPVLFGVVIQIGVGILNVPKHAVGNIDLQTADVPVIGGLEIARRMFTGVDPFVMLLCDIIIIETAFALGLLTGKIAGGTVHNTKNLFISMIIASAVLMLAPQIIEQITQMVAGQQTP